MRIFFFCFAFHLFPESTEHLQKSEQRTLCCHFFFPPGTSCNLLCCVCASDFACSMNCAEFSASCLRRFSCAARSHQFQVPEKETIYCHHKQNNLIRLELSLWEISVVESPHFPPPQLFSFPLQHVAHLFHRCLGDELLFAKTASIFCFTRKNNTIINTIIKSVQVFST